MDKERAIQKKNLFLLDSTISILNKYNINWFAGYGTLLGAIREGGMIPWDHDCDLHVCVDDYNKLLEIGKDIFKSPLFFQTVDTDDYCRHYIRIRLDGTTDLFRKSFNQTDTYHRGMALDIFPLGHLPDNETERNTIIDFRNMFCGKLRGQIGLYKTKLSVEASHFYNNFFTKINADNSKSEYLMDIGSTGIKSYTKILKAVWYENYLELDFNGIKNKIRVPEGYKDILQVWYGADYMIPQKYDFENLFILDPYKDYTEYKNLTAEDFDKILAEGTK